MWTATRLRRIGTYAIAGAGLYLLFFGLELVALVATGLPLSLSETRDPGLMSGPLVAGWQAYHVFIYQQGVWLPVLIVLAALVGGLLGSLVKTHPGPENKA